MGYQIAADITTIIHLSFICFALFGGLLCLHRIHWVGLHLPALAWGVWLEWAGSTCPLTPLENYFRQAAGQEYAGGFIEHYILPLIYPGQMSPGIQWALGSLLLAINLFIYLYVARKIMNRRDLVDESTTEG